MKKYVIAIADIVGTIIWLVIVLKLTAMLGLWSHGYHAHFETVNGESTVMVENYVRILDEEFITNVEYK